MDFAEYFPVFDRLDETQQERLEKSAVLKKIKKGTVMGSGSDDCLGLLLIRSGQLRAFIVSDEGRELTVYRLFDRDMCLFSASCMMNSVQFDISIEAEKDTEAWLIPISVYRGLMDESAVIANHTNEIMSARFTDVMWLMEQVMWKSFDRRLAAFLSEESVIEGSHMLGITHDRIASHLGTAREVVTRMLRYFQGEGIVKLSRGRIDILDEEKLRTLADGE